MKPSYPALITTLLLLVLSTGCRRHGYCEGSDCICDPGAKCEFECEAPPCYVDCVGDNPDCIGACANGDCSCGPGSRCDLSCDAEPCHVNCEDATCLAECGNGDCICAKGSDCRFECTSGPCHVICKGDHKRCNGQCANGSCVCGADSTCSFECLDNDCDFQCESGSECIATCPGGTPGNQGCSFSKCEGGQVELCPDGKTIVCGAHCPD